MSTARATADLGGLEEREDLVLGDEIADRDRELAHDAALRRLEHVLELHRLEHDDGLPVVHLVADRDVERDDRAGERRAQRNAGRAHFSSQRLKRGARFSWNARTPSRASGWWSESAVFAAISSHDSSNVICAAL